jgi:hypothetical protein
MTSSLKKSDLEKWASPEKENTLKRADSSPQYVNKNVGIVESRVKINLFPYRVNISNCDNEGTSGEIN